MEDQSPPKRVTRARAAAKATETAPKMKIATAATKVKATRAATTATSKRKTRADDTHDEDQQTDHQEHSEEPMEKKKSEPARTTRGRAKKPAQEHQDPVDRESSVPAPAPSTRGRPKKTVTEAPPPEPTRTTRGRPKKVDTAAEEPASASAIPVASTASAASATEPVKKTARGGRVATAKAQPTMKKNVTFEDKHDLDKENKLPTRALRGKAKESEEPTGLRAKPIRRPAAAAPRSTRSRAKTVTESEQPEPPAQKSSPLSPKKVTQIATAKDPSSEDELSTMHKTPMRSLTRSPVKPPGSIFDPAKKLDFTTSITVNRLTTDVNPGLLGSPARKAPQSAFLGMNSPTRKAPQAEYKDSLKESPRKLNLGDSTLHGPFKASAPGTSSAQSPFKTPLLQSAARRPPSPVKASASTQPENNTSTLFGATPKASKFKISRFTTPKTISKTTFRTTQPAGESIVRPNTTVGNRFKTINAPPPQHFPKAVFPGRLSAIVPRDIDPVASPAKVVPEHETEETLAEKLPSLQEEQPAITKDRHEDSAKEDPTLTTGDENFKDEIASFQNSTRSTTPPSPPPVGKIASFEPRFEENPFEDSDSEDELASNSPKFSPASLSPLNIASRDFAKIPQTPNAFSAHAVEDNSSSRGGTIRGNRQQVGFTPLARQLSDWMGASPEKGSEDSDSSNSEREASPSKDLQDNIQAEKAPSPSRGGFFDDEMAVRENENLFEDAMDVDGEVVMNEVEPDDEDMALAAEADELSMIGPSELDTILGAEDESDGIDGQQHLMATPAKSVSDCSQEYGDENDVPIDPALLSLDAQLPHTPVARQLTTERVSYTVSKVPLKPAAEASPIKYSPMKRSASASRLPSQRRGSQGADLSKNNTAFSFSPSTPMKSRQDQPLEEILSEINTPKPSKVAAPPSSWSAAATPARTPRRDLDEQLLKGAVVYVDVHTTEGADASGIFVELLTQMGAKCVKTWPWNPNHSSNSPEFDGPSAGSKIGITHVVFKDGGKRTLEKVRESNGIVLCVGVGWVLDCERENSWLDESLYAVDTSLVPRGGHKRRKSMEPKALANLNGTLVPSFTPRRATMGPSARKSLSQDTPATNNRRVSREWVRSPSHSSPEELAALEAMEQDLLPIPATPAPMYSESLLDSDDDDDAEAKTPYFLHPKDLVQMTCPPKKTAMNTFGDVDADAEVEEALGRRVDGDKGVMARLLMARRKSLQFAPKVGSPLARGG